MEYAPRFAATRHRSILLIPAAGQWLAIDDRWRLLAMHRTANAATAYWRTRKPHDEPGSPLDRVEIGPHTLDLSHPIRVDRVAKCAAIVATLADRSTLYYTDTGTLYGPYATGTHFAKPAHWRDSLRRSHIQGQRAIAARPSARNVPLRVTLAADPPPVTYAHPGLSGTFGTLDELHAAARAHGMRRALADPVPAYTMPTMPDHDPQEDGPASIHRITRNTP